MTCKHCNHEIISIGDKLLHVFSEDNQTIKSKMCMVDNCTCLTPQ